MTATSGGCVCGSVRYEFSGEPLMMFNCHCRTCQMISGGPYLPIVVVRAKGFQFTKGMVRHSFTPNVAGGKHKRGFCGDCGSTLTGGEREGQESRWIGLTASSLDDPSLFRPASDIFVTHAQPWDRMDPALPKHEQYPPRG